MADSEPMIQNQWRGGNKWWAGKKESAGSLQNGPAMKIEENNLELAVKVEDVLWKVTRRFTGTAI